MTDLAQLLERVETGAESNNALDVQLEVAFFRPRGSCIDCRPNNAGSKVVYTYGDKPTYGTSWARDYTSSVDAALALIERELPGWFGIYFALECRGGWDRTVSTVECRNTATLVRNPAERSSPTITATAQTTPRALIAALLRAKIAESQP